MKIKFSPDSCKRGTVRCGEKALGSKGKKTAGAGVPVPTVDDAAIAAALNIFCAIPECARDALRRVCEARGIHAPHGEHPVPSNWHWPPSDLLTACWSECVHGYIAGSSPESP